MWGKMKVLGLGLLSCIANYAYLGLIGAGMQLCLIALLCLLLIRLQFSHGGKTEVIAAVKNNPEI